MEYSLTKEREILRAILTNFDFDEEVCQLKNCIADHAGEKYIKIIQKVDNLSSERLNVIMSENSVLQKY